METLCVSDSRPGGAGSTVLPEAVGHSELPVITWKTMTRVANSSVTKHKRNQQQKFNFNGRWSRPTFIISRTINVNRSGRLEQLMLQQQQQQTVQWRYASCFVGMLSIHKYYFIAFTGFIALQIPVFLHIIYK